MGLGAVDQVAVAGEQPGLVDEQALIGRIAHHPVLTGGQHRLVAGDVACPQAGVQPDEGEIDHGRRLVRADGRRDALARAARRPATLTRRLHDVASIRLGAMTEWYFIIPAGGPVSGRRRQSAAGKRDKRP